jgi:hypothetical protein
MEASYSLDNDSKEKQKPCDLLNYGGKIKEKIREKNHCRSYKIILFFFVLV